MVDRPTIITGWHLLWATLSTMEGDAWDAESERLDALWKTEYKAAFVEHALTRARWTRESAEEWADEIADTALAWRRGGSVEPADIAKDDVIECEREWADA